MNLKEQQHPKSEHLRIFNEVNNTGKVEPR